MDLLKSIFPLSFGAKDSSSFITLLIICIIGSVACGVIGWLASPLPVIGWLVGIALGVAGLYIFITLILGILVFLKVLK